MFDYLRIITKLRKLRRIRPDSAWLVATRGKLVALSGTPKPRLASFLLQPKFAPVFAAVLIFALAGGSTVAAAQSALPTNFLYPIKLLSEQMRGAFIIGNEQKAVFALRLAERRILEAEVISSPDFERVFQATDTEVGAQGTASTVVTAQATDPVLEAKGKVVVGAVFKAQDYLLEVKNRLQHVASEKEVERLEKFSDKLTDLEERQHVLAEKLAVKIPKLARLIEAAELGTVEIKQGVDNKIIISIALNSTTSTSSIGSGTSSTTSLPMVGGLVDAKKARQAIERAEHKISLVEEKLERFSNRNSFGGGDDDEDEDEDDGDEDDDLEDILEKGNHWSKDVKKHIARLNELVKKEREEQKNSQEMFARAAAAIAEAKKILLDAKERFESGEYAAAAMRAQEAFMLAVRIEGAINSGAGAALPPVQGDLLFVSGPSVGALSTSSVIVSWTTNIPADSIVEYGTTSSYGASTSATALTVAHAISITGLVPNTVYHFRVRSTDAQHRTLVSSDSTFTTFQIADTTPPVLSSIVVGSTSTSSVTVSWTTNEPSTSGVEYGADVTYGTTSSSSALVTSHVVGVTGLSEGSTYHFRVFSRDAAGNLSVSGDSTFNIATSS